MSLGLDRFKSGQMALGLKCGGYDWSSLTSQTTRVRVVLMELLRTKVYLTSPGPSEIGHNLFIS